MNKKYSLWRLEHVSPYVVMANKMKDTNDLYSVKKWQSESFLNVASFYREEEEINAMYLQTFEN